MQSGVQAEHNAEQLSASGSALQRHTALAVLGSIVTAHAAGGTAAGYADGLSIALVVAATTLLVTAAVTLKLVPSRPP